MEEPSDIAFRYGFSRSEFKALEQNQQFLAEVAAIRSKREMSGEAAIAKAGMMYDVLAERYFLRLLDNDTTTGQLAAGVEAFATLGNRKPKAKEQSNLGSQFSITFNIPAGVPQATTITMDMPEVTKAAKAIESLPSFNTEEEEPSGESEI